MEKHALLILTVLLSIITAARADVLEPATPISRVPCTIAKPGIYTLTGDLVFTGTTGNAITIKADNVIIDFADHTLTYTPKVTSTGAPSADGVYCNGYGNATIRNGAVSGFLDGIVLDAGFNTGHHLVSNITANNCYDAGIYLISDIAEVRGCRTEGCGTYGIFVDYSNIATVEDSQAINCTGGFDPPAAAIGIEVFFAQVAVVRKCVAANSPSGLDGIYLQAITGAGYAFARDNLVSGWSVGIDFGGSTAGKYLNNLTEACTTPFSGGTAATGNN